MSSICGHRSVPPTGNQKYAFLAIHGNPVIEALHTTQCFANQLVNKNLKILGVFLLFFHSYPMNLINFAFVTTRTKKSGRKKYSQSLKCLKSLILELRNINGINAWSFHGSLNTGFDNHKKEIR